ncbi:MAG: hypothetical protein WC842_00675 [Candidatus Paceibacterota bacterium]|jgi:hypothetical protein
MFWKNGNTRFVLIIPALKIAIKFPKIYLFGFIQDSLLYLKNGLFIKACRDTVDSYGLKRLLFKGISENIGEFRFYRKRKYSFLLKTYFSFFGFFNIQEFERDLLSTVEIWYTFNQAATKSEAAVLLKDDHHFSNSKNFFWNGERLKMGDYGGREVQETLRALVEIAEAERTESLFSKSEKRIWESIISGIPEKWKK